MNLKKHLNANFSLFLSHIFFNALLMATTSQEIVQAWQEYQPERSAHALGPVTFNPHNATMLAYSNFETPRKNIKLLDLTHYSKEIVLEKHTGWIEALKFNDRYSHILASSSEDATICLWNIGEPYEMPTVINGHRHCVYSLDFSPHNPSLLASASKDKTVRVWDINQLSEKSLAEQQGKSVVRSVAFSPHRDNLLAYGAFNKNIYLWDVRRQDPAIWGHHDDHVRSVVFNPYNQNMLASASEDKTIRLWDTRKPYAELARLEIDNKINSWILFLAFSPHYPDMLASAELGAITLWDTAAFKKLVSIKASNESIESIAFSPHNQNLFATSHITGNLSLWNMSKECEKVLKPYFINPIARENCHKAHKTRWLLIALDHLQQHYSDTNDYKEQLRRIDSPALQDAFKALPEEVQCAFKIKYKINTLEQPASVSRKHLNASNT